MEEQKNNSANSNDRRTPKVTGVGGIFFFSDNPAQTRKWYAEQLGLDTNDYGCTFEFRSADNPDELAQLQWSPFKKDSDYFAPSKKEFMVNYRVQNIEALVEKLKKNGANVLNDIQSHEYGKFVHLMDPDGNKIELWEPAS